MEMETRSVKIRAVDEAKRIVTFLASSETIDSYDSVIRQNWRLERWNANPVVLFAHNSRDLPIGKGVGLRVVRKETEIDVEFAPAELNPLAEQAFRLVLGGFLRGCSIGFYPHKVSYEEIDNRDVVVLDDNELLELSITPIPANPDALSKLRSRALGTKNVAGSPPKSPATRGEQQENPMTDAEIAALQARAEKRDAEARAAVADLDVARKALETERATTATLTREVEKARADAKTNEERATKAEAAIVERDVEALVGVKITPAEKDEMLELARTNRGLFDKLVAKRANIGGANGLLNERSVLDDDPAAHTRTPATGAGAADHDKLFGDFEKSLGI